MGIKVPFYGADGSSKGEIDVDISALGERVNLHLIRQAVHLVETNMRLGTAKTKNRVEVEGSGRKRHRQKGTGRARVGDGKAPSRRGGGVAFGPTLRDFSLKMNRNARRNATRSALLAKFIDGEVAVIESFASEDGRTKAVAGLLGKLELPMPMLVGIPGDDKKLHLATRNIPRLLLTVTRNFNAYDLVRHRQILLTKEALDGLLSEEKTS